MKISWEMVAVIVGCLMIGLGTDYQSGALATTGLGICLCGLFSVLNKHAL